jgi:hypothetical protein
MKKGFDNRDTDRTLSKGRHGSFKTAPVNGF